MTGTLEKPRQRDAHRIRRHIRHCGIVSGEIHLFACYSMTRAGRAIQHKQEIDLATGEVRCDCESFLFRHAMHHPHFDHNDHHCKHLAPCLAWLRRHHTLETSVAVLRPCCQCGVASAEFEVAGDDGHASHGQYICADCVKRARMMDDSIDDLRFTKDDYESPSETYEGYDDMLDEMDAADDGTCPQCGALLEELPVPYPQSLDYSMEWICPNCDVEVAA
jgi:hypothetical protein